VREAMCALVVCWFNFVFVCFLSLSCRNSILRALTILIEEKWTLKAFQEAGSVTLDLYRFLLSIILSDDTVLTVSRTLLLLAKFSDPYLAKEEALFEAFAISAKENGRTNSMSCLRPAFAGFFFFFLFICLFYFFSF
jgi:hypothetical protein